jgi:hypothetical protein
VSERLSVLDGGTFVVGDRLSDVRGITLNRDEMPVARWIRELLSEVTRAAGLGEQAHRPEEPPAMSPLLGRSRGRRPDADPAQAQLQAQRDAESLERLRQGHIPLAAAERLAALARAEGAPAPFGSDLSVPEFALLHNLGSLRSRSRRAPR